ncbi:MAG TPA: hypothetical protein VIY28_01420 [Pseudonocardiaceae bacterium]
MGSCPDELLDWAKTLARTLAEQSPADTFTVTKAQLHRDTIERIDRYRDDENMLAQRLWVEHAGSMAGSNATWTPRRARQARRSLAADGPRRRRGRSAAPSR